ncbi:endonuclease domain-containing protein [Microbacterium sp. NPDC055312]
MLPGQVFVGLTAMRLWGLPVPSVWTPAEPLHVCVGTDAAPPRGKRVKGRRLVPHRAQRMIFTGAAVVDPVAAVLTTRSDLDFVQLVAAFDALLTAADNYPGINATRPMATRDEIERRLEEWGRFSGCARARRALDLAREGAESPKESETRVRIMESGLPEPVMQWGVYDGGVLVARVDLAYPELKVAIEYEGDGHRTDKEQWRADIRRQRRLEDLGWIVIRLTQSDLTKPSAFLTRLARARATRLATADRA